MKQYLIKVDKQPFAGGKENRWMTVVTDLVQSFPNFAVH